MVYRSKAEMDEWKGRDPVVAFRARLLAEAGVPERDWSRIEQAVQAALDEGRRLRRRQPQARAGDGVGGGVRRDARRVGFLENASLRPTVGSGAGVKGE